MAEEILEKHNPKNRSVSEGTVQSYANDMKNGRWTMTHQGLAFDVNGNLLDGQHRLWALVFAGVSIKFMVTRGMPVEVDGKFTMDAIDRNRVRTTGQQMQLCHSIKNGNVVAAAMRSIAGICNPKSLQHRLSTASSLIIYEIYGPSVEHLLNIAPGNTYRKSFILGPLTMFHKGEPDMASQLLTELVTLENMGPQARAAKKFLDSIPSKLNDGMASRTFSNAIHAFAQNKTIQRLQEHDAGQKFLAGMFPSTTKRIIEVTTPCRVSITNRNKQVK